MHGRAAPRGRPTPPVEPLRAVATLQTARQRVRIHVPCVDCTEPNGMHWFWSAASGSGQGRQWTVMYCRVQWWQWPAPRHCRPPSVLETRHLDSMGRRGKHHLMRCTHRFCAPLIAGGGGGGTPRSPGVATPGMLREVLRKLRGDMMDAEAHVPWSAVRPGVDVLLLNHCDELLLWFSFLCAACFAHQS
jgi:hypothetical protein